MLQGSDACGVAAHNTIDLDNGQLAIISRRNSGWAILGQTTYAAIIEALSTKPRYGNLSSKAKENVLALWKVGLIEVGGNTVIDDNKAPAHPTNILIKLTEKCNYACTYCYDFHDSPHSKDLPLEKAKETLDYVLKAQQNEKITISFHGGEPLLYFKKIEQLVDYVEHTRGRGQIVEYSVQTNGTLFNSQVIDFLQSHNFSVGISLDGSSENANKYRISKHGETPLGKIEALIRQYPDFVHNHCGVMVVVTDASIGKIPEFALWLQENGITSLSLVLFQTTGRAEDCDPNIVSLEEILSMYDVIIRYIEDGVLDRLFIKNIISCLINFMYFANGEVCYRGICMASKNFLVLSPDGTFKVCDCSDKPEFVLGDSLDAVKRDPSERRINIVRRSQWLGEYHSDCSRCEIFGLCGGGCAARASTNNKDYISIDAVECALFRKIYKKLLNDYASHHNSLFDYYERYANQR